MPSNLPPPKTRTHTPHHTAPNSTVGGGGLYNGSAAAYTGRPSYPFDSSNRYFRTRQGRKIAFALVNNAPLNVTSPKSMLYFDWFVDNPWPYWFVGQTMSINANNSDIVVHQARVDLYDYDKLVPPGNFTDLASQVFDQYDATAGPAYLGPVLPAEVIAATPNLVSMSTEAPLGPYVGKRVLVAFRYSTTVNYIAWGIDNVMVVECGLDGGKRGNGTTKGAPKRDAREAEAAAKVEAKPVSKAAPLIDKKAAKAAAASADVAALLAGRPKRSSGGVAPAAAVAKP
jgi:hypothetical protein